MRRKTANHNILYIFQGFFLKLCHFQILCPYQLFLQQQMGIAILPFLIFRVKSKINIVFQTINRNNFYSLQPKIFTPNTRNIVNSLCNGIIFQMFILEVERSGHNMPISDLKCSPYYRYWAALKKGDNKA